MVSAGICVKGGYEYAVSVYHYAMTLAYAAQAETLQYHENTNRAQPAFDTASLHMRQLEVRYITLHVSRLWPVT